MSNAELESLIVGYLEGTATRAQVIRLRDAIKSSPEMNQRFQARLRLHRAQLSFLRHKEDRSAAGAMLSLHRFSQRVGRSFAHLCLLALVFVQLRVTIPSEYTGLLFYVEAPVAAEPTALEPERVPAMLVESAPESEGALGAGKPDVVMPAVMPDAVSPAEDPTSLEV
jgi:hypothetical protein